MINPGIVAAIRVVGVRGDPCGAMRWTTLKLGLTYSYMCAQFIQVSAY